MALVKTKNQENVKRNNQENILNHKNIVIYFYCLVNNK